MNRLEEGHPTITQRKKTTVNLVIFYQSAPGKKAFGTLSFRVTLAGESGVGKRNRILKLSLK